MDGWHVRCWCGLRIVENAGEASPYLEICEKTKVLKRLHVLPAESSG